MTIDSRKVFKIYKSLERDQLKFVLDKKIEDTLTISEWLEKLRRIAVMDTLGDETRRRSGNLSVTFGILTVAGFFLTIYQPILFFFPIGFLLLFLYFTITFFLLNKIDIRNNMRLFIVPLLEHYDRQGTVEKPFKLRMDFSNPISKERLQEEDEEDQAGSGNKYRHHWMDGNMEFKDGVKISWEIEDVVRKRESRIKGDLSSTSGKYQIAHVLNMRFAAPLDHFSVAKDDIMKTDDGKYYIIAIHKKDISESLEEAMSLEIFIESVEEGYNFLTPHPQKERPDAV